MYMNYAFRGSCWISGGRDLVADIYFIPLHPYGSSGTIIWTKGMDLAQGPEFGDRILLTDCETMWFLRLCIHQIVKYRPCRLGTLISEASFAWLSSKFTRNQIITVATIITVIGYMLFMSVGYILPKSIVLLNIIGFLIFFSQGAFNMTMIVMLNNTIEYDEVRFHERHDSIISAVRSFATKLAQENLLRKM